MNIEAAFFSLLVVGCWYSLVVFIRSLIYHDFVSDMIDEEVDWLIENPDRVYKGADGRMQLKRFEALMDYWNKWVLCGWLTRQDVIDEMGSLEKIYPIVTVEAK